MATRRRFGSRNLGATEAYHEAVKYPDSGSQGKQKVDELVDIIRSLVDAQGYFDPKDVHEQVRNTDLAKSASIVMSNLRLQGFGKDDKLKVPVSDRPDAIKKLINMASRLRKKGVMIPYDEAVAIILSEPEEMTDAPRSRTLPQTVRASEPQAPLRAQTREVPAPVRPVIQKSVPAAPALQRSESDYRVLYEESRAKALQLEAELEAYKQMCFRLIDTFRK
jgi:hypothetical protein